jgi:hypothetical protein
MPILVARLLLVFCVRPCCGCARDQSFSARATTQFSTRVAPCFLSVRASSSSVAPVVMTSSTTSTDFPVRSISHSTVRGRRRRRGTAGLPFNDLLFQAQQVHRAHFDANSVQRSTLLSVKTGGCFRGLRLLLAGGAPPYRAGARKPCWRSTRSSPPPKPPRKRAPAASAWAPPGAGRRTRISSR